MTKFNIISFLESHAIAIPAIQRGYVHGENTPKAKETLGNFISCFRSLMSADEKDAPFSLDFTYGVEDHGAVIPIDGQQRITTLWLTYLFCVHRFCPEQEKEAHLSRLRRFSYLGRTSANAFCRELCQSSENYNAILRFREKPRESDGGIQGECGEDSTVASMRRTLSALGEALTAETSWENCLRALRNTVFEYVDIRQDAGDVDAEELYVKINARGRTLTQWENLKGKVSDVSDNDTSRIFKDEIEKLSDRFYANHSKLPDDAFFALLARLTDYVLCEYEKGDNGRRPNLSALADAGFRSHEAAPKYVPLEEFCLEKTASQIIQPALRMIKWALDNPEAVLWYWKSDRSAAESLFSPKNANERDFSLVMFEYFRKYENGVGLTRDNGQALRFVANVLENAERGNESERFNRVRRLKDILGKCPSLYDENMSVVPVDNRLDEQIAEEAAKAVVYASHPGHIKLLQSCESLLRGRVRIALIDAVDGKWSVAGLSFRFAERLLRLKSAFDGWTAASEDGRKTILEEFVKCEPWELQDAIRLSLKCGDNCCPLRELLSTRDDKFLQHTYVDQDTDARQTMPCTSDSVWVRDWRTNVFKEAGWEDREVRWHSGTGTYYLYRQGIKTISLASPVSDWRFDLKDDVSAFSELCGDKDDKIDSIRVNDGGTRSFRCAWGDMKNFSVNIYLWKEGVEIRWFNYDGERQRSEWIYARDMPAPNGKADAVRLVDIIKEKLLEMQAQKANP